MFYKYNSTNACFPYCLQACMLRKCFTQISTYCYMNTQLFKDTDKTVAYSLLHALMAGLHQGLFLVI